MGNAEGHNVEIGGHEAMVDGGGNGRRRGPPTTRAQALDYRDTVRGLEIYSIMSLATLTIARGLAA